jgi:hypothetical protein
MTSVHRIQMAHHSHLETVPPGFALEALIMIFWSIGFVFTWICEYMEAVCRVGHKQGGPPFPAKPRHPPLAQFTKIALGLRLRLRRKFVIGIT